MKIAFIIDSIEGGAGRVLYDILNNLDKKFKPILISIYNKGNITDSVEKLRTKIIYLDKKDGKGFDTIIKIKDILKKEKVKIVHTHNIDAYEYGILAAKIAGIKNIVHTAHGKSEKGGNYKRLRENIFHKFISLFVDQYTAVSKDLRRYAKKNWSFKKVKVIYNGVDPEKYKPKKTSRDFLKKYGISEKDKLVGIVAGLRKVKNHQMIIKAMIKIKKEVPDTKLLIIGDGPERLKLERLVENLKLKKEIIFLGNRKDIPRLLNCIDVNVLCSYSECLSMTLLEAMASEIPCIATKVGGNPELIEKEFLVRLNDTDDLAIKTIIFLKNKELKKKIKKKLREKIIKDFTLKKMIYSYQKLYKLRINL